MSLILFLVCPVRPSRSQLASGAHHHPFWWLTADRSRRVGQRIGFLQVRRSRGRIRLQADVIVNAIPETLGGRPHGSDLMQAYRD